MSTFIKKGDTKCVTPINKNKKFFYMLKITKSHPASKGNRVKKVFSIDYQSFTNINLTAMPSGVLLFKEQKNRTFKIYLI